MPDHVKCNPLVRIRWGSPLLCDLLLEGDTVQLPDIRYVSILAAAKEPISLDDIQARTSEILSLAPQDAGDVVADLVQHRVLLSALEIPPRLQAAHHWIDRGWLDALIFHLRTWSPTFAEDGAPNPQELQNSYFRSQSTEERPALWKEYPGENKITLSVPRSGWFEEPLDSVLLRRRSNKPYVSGVIPEGTLSSILYFANQATVTARRAVEAEQNTEPRTFLVHSAFSALESYVVVHRVQGLSPGLYHYECQTHKLALLRAGDLNDAVIKLCVGQAQAGGSAFTVLITAIWRRYMFRYRSARAFRNLMINVGEMGQKYLLLATARHLSTFLTPNMDNRFADDLLGVNGYDEALLYAISAG